jgi:diguanylate cyclase (GGDEF)-like protein/PAS domain S-box-containing protein
MNEIDPYSSRANGKPEEITILVVEDEEITALDIKTRLEKLGYHVPETVNSGEEAILLAEQLKPDLILMDIVLKGEMLGTTAAQQISTQYYIPIIFLTSFGDDATVKKAKIAGAYGYITKPFETRDLRIGIEMALFKHDLQIKLEMSELRFRNTFDHATVGMALLTLNEKFIQVNPAFSKMLGYTEKELLSLSLSDLVHKDDQGITPIPWPQLLNDEVNSFQLEKRYQNKSGQEVWALVSASLVRNTKNLPLYFIFQAQDITARKLAEKNLTYLSQHDMLTNLYNRSVFEETLQRKFIKLKKGNELLAILMIDLDNFKTINDTFGHHVGDQLLITIGKKLQESVREEDFVARLGGDEFVVIMSNVNDIKDITVLAKNLVNQFNKPFKIEDHYFHATISIGIAVTAAGGDNSQTLLKNADIALYAVKELGRNNYQFYSDKINNAFTLHTQLENELPTALAEKQLMLVYQPQYKLPTKEVAGMEVLLKWQHPLLGLISPNDFIPLAEKNGFIVQIGEWMLRTACKQYTEWKTKKIISPKLNFTINLSAVQLAKENFLNVLLAILQETKMSPKNLEIELTETAVMTSAMNLDPIFDQLQKIGIKISINDFGMGYSSLCRLKSLPISTLKIDKSFISNLGKNKDDEMIVKSIIALGNSLGLSVITEGVENEEQLNLLIQYHCAMVQGFYFEKQPLSAHEMSRFLENL